MTSTRNTNFLTDNVLIYIKQWLSKILFMFLTWPDNIVNFLLHINKEVRLASMIQRMIVLFITLVPQSLGLFKEFSKFKKKKTSLWTHWGSPPVFLRAMISRVPVNSDKEPLSLLSSHLKDGFFLHST